MSDSRSIVWNLDALPAGESSEDVSLLGASLASFEVEELLGQGGMGSVYRARDAAGRLVALKVQRFEGALADQRRQRFVREGELLARLRHPGILRVHTSGEDEGRAFLVCELLQGSLREAWGELPARGEDLERGIGLLLQAARGLGHAHAQGVVHRDLKPENVFVDTSGRACVGDFGLAWGEGVEALTRTGEVFGTPLYLAPECLSDPQPDPRSDVWALGVMLYELVAGVLPYDAETLLSFCELLANEPPRSLRETAPSASRDLVAICERALSRNPAERYADASAFAEALAAADPRPSRPRWPLAAGVLALALAPIGLAVAGPGLSTSTPSPPPTESAPSASAAPRAPDPFDAALRRGALDAAAGLAEAAPQRSLLLLLQEARALEARIARLEETKEQFVPGQGDLGDLARRLDELLGAAPKRATCVSPATRRVLYGRFQRLLGRGLLVFVNFPTGGGPPHEERAALAERARLLDPTLPAPEIGLGLAWSSYHYRGKARHTHPDVVRGLPVPGAWSADLEPKARFLAHALWFLVAPTRAESDARLEHAEAALLLPPPVQYQGQRVRWDVARATCARLQARAYWAAARGDEAESARWRARLLERVELIRSLPPGPRTALAGMVLHEFAAHLLSGDLARAEALLARFEAGRTDPALAGLLRTELHLVRGQLALAQQSWSARQPGGSGEADAQAARQALHLRWLGGEDAPLPAWPPFPNEAAVLEWRSLEAMRALERGGWWPGLKKPGAR